MVASRRRKPFRIIAFIAIFLLAIQLVTAHESDSSPTYDLKEEEISADAISTIEVITPGALDLKEDSTLESTMAEPIGDDVTIETPVSDDIEGEIDDPIVPTDESALKEMIMNKEDEEQDNLILEAAVSSLGESVSSKLSTIANRIKSLTLSKQNAKKIVAAGLGAWGAATGVGWAMQNFGGKKN